MFKRYLFATIISLFFASQANAWEMGAYVENAQAGEGLEADSSWQSSVNRAYQTDHTMAQTSAPKDTLKHHSFSFTYGIIALTDFTAASASVGVAIFSFGTAELQKSIPGAFSFDYGYKFNDVVESGIVFNYAHPVEYFSVFTFMPKLKLNFNNDGFLNPFLELEAGVSFFANKKTPIFHITFIGLEIGRDFPIILHLLSFGQRGVVSAGFGVRI